VTRILEQGKGSANVTSGKEGEVIPDTRDAAMLKGGIDMNSANLNLKIKRNGKGVPLPLIQQDMSQLAGIEGFVPVIIRIKPIIALPQLNG
jgi:hypothetical protein